MISSRSAVLHRSRLAAVLVVALLLVVRASPASAARRSARTAGHVPAWSHTMRDGPWGLAVDHGGAVVTGDLHHIESLDPRGRLRWRAKVDSIWEASPAIDARLVVVGGRRWVTVLARANGAMRWRRPMGDDVTAMAIAGNLVIAGDHAGTLTAFDAKTGHPRWSVHYDGRLYSAPRVDFAAGAVVATWHWSSAPMVRVFDLETGALRWQAPTAGYTAAPVVTRGLVIVAFGSSEGNARIVARDLETGAPRWGVPVPGPFEEAIEPAVNGHDYAVVDHNGVVTLLDPATGAVRWQHDTDYLTIESRIALTAHRVVFTSFSGDLFALDRKSGRVVSQQNWRRLGGFPIAYGTVSWLPPDSLLVALREIAPFRVEVLPLS